MELESVVRESQRIAVAFRQHCVTDGYIESDRVPIRTFGDQTIRFHNSSISVLARGCDFNDTPLAFLLQPALRLRNQSHVNATGNMSPFGCYFVAFGTVAPPRSVEEVFSRFESFFLDALEIPTDRLVLRATSADRDLCSLLQSARVSVELDGCDLRLFRHTFGIETVTGRNLNMAIVSNGKLYDVANLLLMEREGMPWAIETAFGINNIVARIHQLPHPVLATTAVSLPRTVDANGDLIRKDALSSGIALAFEGFVPRARGREGNYRRFVAALTPLWVSNRDALRQAVESAAQAEAEIRRNVSPLQNQASDLTASHAAAQLMDHVQYLAQAHEEGTGTLFASGREKLTAG